VYKNFIKRVSDAIIAILLLLLFAPILVACMLLLLVSNNGMPFFFQKRPGLNGKIFTIVKFKTMNDAMDKAGQLLPDAKRLTPFGRVIRKTSLDELPQLINVFKGDMSLIGPRPLLVEYVPLYNEVQKRRHEVRPGITGWAQVNGRNAISWQEKFELDVWYVDHCSFGLDMKILWLTILKVFKREGINQAGQATVEKFNGHN
jgi:lipopolysaccharide/colanic/teichoic acid biosynthesis glycosyltransferase